MSTSGVVKSFHKIGPAFIALSASFLAASGSAVAAKIDFESIPDAFEGLSITDQFQASYGVSFSLGNGTAPKLARVGGTLPSCFAFLYSSVYDRNGVAQNPQCDTSAPQFANTVGQWFLTDDGVVGTESSPLIITYTNPVSGASGEILDIDGLLDGTVEEWTIEALDGQGNVLDRNILTAQLPYHSPDPNNLDDDVIYPGDGVPFIWSFNSRPQADIYAIRIKYTGTKLDGIGLAFDNFDTNSPRTSRVPEPSSVIGLLAIGGFSVASVYKRKRLRS